MIATIDQFAVEPVIDSQILLLKEEELQKIYRKKYGLLVYEEPIQVQVVFYSSSPSVRALEIMEYLLSEFGLVKGDAQKAQGLISFSILNSLITDAEEEDVVSYFRIKIKEYLDNTLCVIAKEYARENCEKIKALPRYVKRKMKWAMVKTTDIAPIGEHFILKSLENESGIRLEVIEQTYIMIASRGEIYNITAEKFEKTYELSDEKLDVFAEMMDYIPEVRLVSNGQFISIDDKAHVCYPKRDYALYVMQLTVRTKVFQNDGTGEYFLGREGDYLVFREDEIEDIYIIQKDIFKDTYEPATDREGIEETE